MLNHRTPAFANGSRERYEKYRFGGRRRATTTAEDPRVRTRMTLKLEVSGGREATAGASGVSSSQGSLAHCAGAIKLNAEETTLMRVPYADSRLRLPTSAPSLAPAR